MRLLLRADGSTDIGLGHVMRCLALGQAWQDAGGDVIFVSRALHPDVRIRLERERFEVRGLDESIPAGSAGDAAATSAIASIAGSHHIVIDGYTFGADYEATLIDAGAVLGVIDDYGHADRYVAHVLVNQNLGATVAMYPGVTAELLLGPRYAMLRREFVARRAAPRSMSHVPAHVLVTLGGSDADNVTATVLRGLSCALPGALQVRALIGATNPHRANLEAEFAGNIELLPFTDRMADELAWADVAITGGGTTCWELCCLGVPSAVVILADNQRIVAAGMSGVGAAVNVGLYEQLDKARVLEVVLSIVGSAERARAMSEAGQTLVDGAGGARVVAALKAARHG